MLRLTELRLPLDHPEEALHQAVFARLGTQPAEMTVFKRSVDARKKSGPVFIYTVDCSLASPAEEAEILRTRAADPHLRPAPDTRYRPVGHAPADFAAAADTRRPVVVGFGPCGIFAALVLAQMGLQADRAGARQGGARAHQGHLGPVAQATCCTPSRNVQFGEGGAGTFSDGKLYSQIKDPRHLGRKVMTEFVKAGAPPEILYAAHPHIGTFKLVKVVENMREQIIALGGEIRFEQRVDRLADRGRRTCAASRSACWTRPRARASCAPTTWCWRWATARATPSTCCTSAACTWRPSRSPSAFASSIRRA